MNKYNGLFITRLKIFMAEKGLSQTELAKITGIARPQINNYISGNNEPGLEVMGKIAESLGRPLADFFKEEITLSSNPNIETLFSKASQRDQQLVLEILSGRETQALRKKQRS